MITYHSLQTFIIFNLVLVGIFLLTAMVFKKTTGIMMFLASLCWMGFSWYYQLRIGDHLVPGTLSDHFFVSLFVTIVYGFGCWLSFILTFMFAVTGVHSLLSPDVSTGKRAVRSRHNHSPWPLWIVCMLAGLISAALLHAGRIPQLNKLMDIFTNLIYEKVLHVAPEFPSCYLPAAGIAAGTIVTACFSGLYRRSALPAVSFLSVILVPVVTAVFAPLVDFAGSLMVIILVIAAYVMKDAVPDVPVRSPVPFILLAIGTGILSGYYFYANGLVIYRDEKVLTIVGGIAAGITIACLAYRSFSCEESIFRALYFLGLIPFCTPGFSSGVAYALALVGAFIFLGIGLSSNSDKDKQVNLETNMRTQGGDPVYNRGSGYITFSENGQMVDAMESSYMDTYVTSDGREYVKRGTELCRVR